MYETRLSDYGDRFGADALTNPRAVAGGRRARTGAYWPPGQT